MKLEKKSNAGKATAPATTTEKKKELPAVQGKRPLIKIEEIYKDVENAAQYNELNRLINAAPKPEWFMNHPTAKVKKINPTTGQLVEVPAVYLPIARLEYLLTAIFQRVRVEIKWSKLVANSLEVAVRLHFFNPVLNEWDWQDGIGAVPLQTDKGAGATEKGAGATEFDKIKSNAVQIAAPAAKTFAVKDAAEQIGKLFGKDINRADDIGYNFLEKQFHEEEKPLNQ